MSDMRKDYLFKYFMIHHRECLLFLKLNDSVIVLRYYYLHHMKSI
jgi:hypothetical protein